MNPLNTNEYGQATFLKSESGRYSYARLFEYSKQFESYLSAHGVEHGSKIALLSESSDELVLAIASCWIWGYPIIPLSHQMTGHEIETYIRLLKPAVILTGRNIDDNIIKSGTTVCPIPAIQKLASETVVPHPVEIQDEESIFGYFFTSGTTNNPKIVPLKRRQINHAAQAGALNFKPGKNGLWLLCLPVNHVGGISVILRSLLYGSGIYRLDRFTAGTVTGLLKDDDEIEAASLVPTMLTRLLNEPGFRLNNRFKAILLGGGSVPRALQQQVSGKRLPVVYSYGMTETCAQIAAVPLDSRQKIPTDSAGRLFKGNQIRIRDNSGNTVPANSEGMIWLKGPQVFDGYLLPPDAPVFDEERWFKTGDFGKIDKQGNIFILSRRSDLIVSGGENINPFEVEDALTSLPFVREAAVVGEPDPEWGQSVVAVIAPCEGCDQATVEEIRLALSGRLTRHKLPKKALYVDRLPRTRSGKIIRRNLLEWIKGHHS